ncbi:MAG: arginase family protein, partial [Betaproteobacteria bacterium]|nr:arginase family protein [Betaproteobacteria bacterium]
MEMNHPAGAKGEPGGLADERHASRFRASGAGARNKACEAGPDAVRAGGLASRLQMRGLSAAWHETIRPREAGHDDSLQVVKTVCQNLAQRTRAIVAHGGLPVVVGGDHSCAIGTWKGVASALRA